MDLTTNIDSQISELLSDMNDKSKFKKNLIYENMSHVTEEDDKNADK